MEIKSIKNLIKLKTELEDAIKNKTNVDKEEQELQEIDLFLEKFSEEEIQQMINLEDSEEEIQQMINLEEKATIEQKEEIKKLEEKIHKNKRAIVAERDDYIDPKKLTDKLKKIKEVYKCEFNKEIDKEGNIQYTYEYKDKTNKIKEENKISIKNSPFSKITTTSIEELKQINEEIEEAYENGSDIELIFDTETFDISSGIMLEFGGVLKINGKKVKDIHLYANPWISKTPPRTKSVPKDSVEVHNITKEMLEGGISYDKKFELDKPAPSFEEYGSILKDIFDKSKLIAHNAKFDINVMESEFKRIGIEEKISENSQIIDTLSLFRLKVPKSELEEMGLKGYNLDTFLTYIKQKYNIKTDDKDRSFHGALLDSEILDEAYEKFKIVSLDLIEMIEAEFFNKKETSTQKEDKKETSEKGNKTEKIKSNIYFKTDRAIGEGSVNIKEIVEKAKSEGIETLTLMDTYRTNGHRKFHDEAEKVGIKTQYGSKFLIEIEENKFIEINCIVKNEEGYNDFNNLITLSYKNIKDEKKDFPHLKLKDFIEKDEKGRIAKIENLIVSIPQKENENIYETIEELKKIETFKEKSLYIEPISTKQLLKDANEKTNMIENEKIDIIKTLADKYKLKTNITEEILYTDDKDFIAHKTLQGITKGKEATGTFFSEDLKEHQNKSLNTKRIKEKEEQEISELEQEFNSDEIEYKMNAKRTIFPKLPIEGDTEEERHNNVIKEFLKAAREGLDERIKEDNPTEEEIKKLKERLESEISIILEMEENQKGQKDAMAYAEYFLFVKDYVNWAKNNDVLVGPGRGSGAGSLIAYAMRITEVEVEKYDLLFERFINPERVSEPDFDVDFAGIIKIDDIKDEEVKKEVKKQRPKDELIGGKDLVLIYMQTKYKDAQVAKTLTEGKIQAKSAISDTCRIFGDDMAQILFDNNPFLAKIIKENNPSIKDTLRNVNLSNFLKEQISDDTLSLKENLTKGKLKKLYEGSHIIRKILDVSVQVEEKIKAYGAHAGAVVLDFEINKPVGLVNGENVYLQTMYDSELVKFDFLGLKTLDVIHEAVNSIEEEEKTEIDFKKIDYKDDKTFTQMSEGNTVGVFQIESDGMQSLVKEIKPNSIEDIIAILALYRPGPMDAGMLDDYKARKKGAEIQYNLKEEDFNDIEDILKDILEPTLGVVVYQEQVIRIVREIGGFSLGDADLVRRAMGKKDVEKMAMLKDEFSTRAEKYMKETKNINFPKEVGEKLFSIIEKFAGYGFNKSHSAGYAMETFKTQFLKANYPKHFYKASFNNKINYVEKLGIYMKDAVKNGIEILLPDINQSEARFTLKDDKILFGLEAIKGIGGVDVKTILKNRAEEGEFKSLKDFLDRVFVKKSSMENLILAGAFDNVSQLSDDIYEDRKQKLQEFYNYERGKKTKTAKDKQIKKSYENEGDFFEIEKDLLSHPLSVTNVLTDENVQALIESQNETLKDKISNEGWINNFKTVLMSHKVTKSKKTKKDMAYLTFSDGETTIEATCFDKNWEKIKDKIKSNTVVNLNGQTQYSKYKGTNQIIIRDLETIEVKKSKKINEKTEQKEKKQEIIKPKLTQNNEFVIIEDIKEEQIIKLFNELLEGKENNKNNDVIYSIDNKWYLRNQVGENLNKLYSTEEINFLEKVIKRIEKKYQIKREIIKIEEEQKSEKPIIKKTEKSIIIQNIPDKNILEKLKSPEIGFNEIYYINGNNIEFIMDKKQVSEDDIIHMLDIIEKIKTKYDINEEQIIKEEEDSKKLYKKGKEKVEAIYAKQGQKETNIIIIEEYYPDSIKEKIEKGIKKGVAIDYLDEYNFVEEDKPMLFILSTTKIDDINKTCDFIQFLSNDAPNINTIIINDSDQLSQTLNLKEGLNRIKIGGKFKFIYKKSSNELNQEIIKKIKEEKENIIKNLENNEKNKKSKTKLEK
jgi:DNA polymerase-3 subunit alpha